MIGHQPRRSAQGGRERGVILMIICLTLVPILFVVAIVVDLGYTRGGASLNQSSADLAALAGGKALSQRRYVAACTDIVKYINTNATGIPAINATNFCAGFATTVCSSGTANQVTPTATSGKYTVSIRFPVPDSEIGDTTFGAGLLDGLSCERMRVSITSREPSFFGGIGGKQFYSINRTATVRGGANVVPLVPALWLLDPVGCSVLNVQGGSKVLAGDVSDPNHIIPGVILVDSDGSGGCSQTSTTLVTGGAGTEVRALPLTGPTDRVGQITLRALPFGYTSCTGTTACDQSAVGTEILPQPTAAPVRATRAPVDWAWNCKASYPNYLGIPVEGCPNADRSAPYIDRLISGAGSNGRPAGYQKWSSFHSCNPAGTVTVSGNWWVDCRTPNGLSIGNGSTVTFSGGNVIFDGGLKLLGGGALNINTNNPSASLPAGCSPPTLALPCMTSSSSGAAFAYVRDGDWNLGGGTFTANATTLYLSPDSVLKGSGGSPPSWTSPSQGPFAGLSLWAEADDAFVISGGAGVSLQGSFFTPFADELTLTGGGSWGQQNAQFISYRLKVGGGSYLTMSPDPTSAVKLPPRSATLIR